MLNIALSVHDCGQVWDVRSVESELDWSCEFDYGMGCRWGSEFNLSRRERADTRQGLLWSMIHVTSFLNSVTYFIHMYKTTPSNKSDPPDRPTWQPTGSFPRVASNCALSCEHPWECWVREPSGDGISSSSEFESEVNWFEMKYVSRH